MRPLLAAFCLACLLVLCPASSAQQRHNILLIIADDMGVDLTNCYHVSPGPNHTPVIDSLAAKGVLFRNCWAQTVCSPSRSTLFTGRYGFRTGLGLAINYDLDHYEVQLSETSLPEILAPAYRRAAIGKWHMSAAPLSGTMHPLLMGFEHHAGSMAIFPGVINDNYYSYDKSVDGVVVHSTVYATTDTVNDCLARIQSFGSDPWFVWLAFNAPHAPFHKPPPNLHTFNLPQSVAGNIPIHVKATVEAMDTEMGRLFASMDPAVLANTDIIFLGDNGTSALAVEPPFLPSHAKGTLYEGGVNVPLIMCGPDVAVAGAECDALVNSTDVFATVADIAGVPHPTAVDAVSLLPYLGQPGQPSLRSWIYTDYFVPNGYDQRTTLMRAVRQETYKLIWTYDSVSHPVPLLQLFNLKADPFELTDLMPGPLTPEQQAAVASMQATLASLAIPWAKISDGLAGVSGIPDLTGTGDPVPGSVTTLTLSNAKPLAPATLVIGLDSINKPFRGGIMGPAPDILVPVVVQHFGSLPLQATWPAGVPAGVSIFFQYWIEDPAAVHGFSGSNTAVALTPM